MEVTTKRDREDSDGLPEAKRLRSADLTLLGILEDGDAGSPDPAAGDIDSVMKSLEEEIAAPVPSPPLPPLQHPAEDGAKQATSQKDCGEPRPSDLYYLLEASDDDLGLPPTASPFSGGGEAALGDLAGIGHIWGFPDEFPGGALGLAGLGQHDDVAGGGRGGGDLFDLDDVATFWPSDFSDSSWRRESLSAV